MVVATYELVNVREVLDPEKADNVPLNGAFARVEPSVLFCLSTVCAVFCVLWSLPAVSLHVTRSSIVEVDCVLWVLVRRPIDWRGRIEVVLVVSGGKSFRWSPAVSAALVTV